jgi:hypothetical protein
MPAGMPPIDLAALMSGTTNVVRELKSSGWATRSIRPTA